MNRSSASPKVQKTEDAAPPDRRSLRDARRFKKESEQLLRKHTKKLTTEQRERVEAAIGAVDEQVERGKNASKKQLAGAVKDLDQVVDDVLGFAKKSSTREFFESITVAILIAAVLRAFVIEAFKIPSGSMIPTLEVGDHIFVNKFIYGLRVPFTNSWIVEWSTPDRGDVIVFRYPQDISKDYIKRVVAVAGDRVRVEHRDVLVNDKKLERGPPQRYAYWEDVEPGEQPALGGEHHAYAFPEHSLGPTAKSYTVLYEDKLGEAWPQPGIQRNGLDCTTTSADGHLECTILPGYLFAMGDNRDNSSDGRAWGGVPTAYVKGKAMFVWWSRGERSGIRWGRFFTWIE